MKYYYVYEVLYYNEIDDEEVVRTGVTYGEDYHEALANILVYYGSSNICNVKIESWDAEGCLEITKEALADIFAQFN